LVGIGVNLYAVGFPEDIRDIAVSLEEATGTTVDFASFAVSLAEKISKFDPGMIPEYIEKYRELSLAIGRTVTVVTASEKYSAQVLDVNGDGTLRVLPEGADEPKNLISGEISIRMN